MVDSVWRHVLSDYGRLDRDVCCGLIGDGKVVGRGGDYYSTLCLSPLMDAVMIASCSPSHVTKKWNV